MCRNCVLGRIQPGGSNAGRRSASQELQQQHQQEEAEVGEDEEVEPRELCACECISSELIELYLFGRTCKDCHHRVIESQDSTGDSAFDCTEGMIAPT
jgi:hypothetical protein